MPDTPEPDSSPPPEPRRKPEDDPPPARPSVPGPIGPFIPPWRGPGRLANAVPWHRWAAGWNRS